MARISLFSLMLAAAGLPLYIHLPQFVTAELGLTLSTLAVILTGIRIMDFVQDPLLGRLVDRFPAQRGTLAMLSALGMALGFAMLFSWNPGAPIVLWLVLSLVLVFSAYSLGSVLFYSQSTALAGPSRDLVRMAAFRESGALTGIILAATAPALLMALGAGSGGYPVFGLCLAGLCLISWRLCRPLWRGTARASQPLTFRALRGSGGMSLLGLSLVNALPVAITSTLFLFYVGDRLNLPQLAGGFLILFFLAAGASVPLWSRMCARFDTRHVLLTAMALAILCFVSAAILPAGAAITFAAICLGSGAALGADMVILPVLFARSLDRAGLQGGQAFGLWSFAAKLALALAAILLLPLLDLIGFRPGQANTDSALMGLTLAYAVLPCLLKLGAIALVLRLPQEVLLP